MTNQIKSNSGQMTPQKSELEQGLKEASQVVQDVVLKNYLTKLTDYEVVPMDEKLKDLNAVRIFKITEMVYEKDEYATSKFASVFNSLQNLNCGIYIIVDSDGEKTDFYMGVRSYDDERTTSSLYQTLDSSIKGHFPGIKNNNLSSPEIETLIGNFEKDNIAAVSGVARSKSQDDEENAHFIQGLEKLALAMQGKKYTSIVVAKAIPSQQIVELRNGYEKIYSQLSPFAQMQVSYGSNTAKSVSEAFTNGTTTGTSSSTNSSVQEGSNYSSSTSSNESTSKSDLITNVTKAAGSALITAANIAAAPMTGGASYAVAGLITAGNIGMSAINPSTETEGTSDSKTFSESKSATKGESFSTNDSQNESNTKTDGVTSGTSDNLQLTMQNKSLQDMLKRIDAQLERIEEAESLGMWESAAYFLSDFQETAEIAAGTYKALMSGDKSGVEMSAVNFWGNYASKNKNNLTLIGDYVTHFVHPIFAYPSESEIIPITPASVVSSNELALQMGLPRKSVVGFPVIEHENFGKEVVRSEKVTRLNEISLGKIFNMGSTAQTNVSLDKNSLTAHTFVTGSTGAGKSNAVYVLLNQMYKKNIPFLVIEPAKGEYKNVFGQFSDVKVYGTNPKKAELLKINPFRFPSDIHILEHLDRLVEIFNVCWPMYAAMPAILKESIEKAYINVGWDLEISENTKGNVYPSFKDVLDQINDVVNSSSYSADTKGDYSGALLTRIRSLTTGLNQLIFTEDDLDDETLFDNSTIVDLSRVGSSETKSLIMGLLVMKLNEYRMTSDLMNSDLQHITVLEEAHHLLKQTSSEQSSEGSNLLGKSVELLANSIAEMRTYGEGFIIADQAPGLLDRSVIRNTNTKIILRVPEKSDRELVGFSAGLNSEQLDELTKLEKGVAAVYQNDWIEPVLVKINKSGLEEKKYEYIPNQRMISKTAIRKELVKFLIQGRVDEKMEFDVDFVENNYLKLGLSNDVNNYIEDQIDDYRDGKMPNAWEPQSFRTLSRNLTEIMDATDKVDYYTSIAKDDLNLTLLLVDLIEKNTEIDNPIVQQYVAECLMKDYSRRPAGDEMVYVNWLDYIKGGVL